MNAIDERYVDAFGVERVVPQATRDAFAAVLGSVGDAEPIVPETIVVRDDGGVRIVLTVPAARWIERCAWTLVCEDETVRRGTLELRDAPVLASYDRDGATIDRRALDLGDLPLGYHRLSLDIGSVGHADAHVVVVPPTAYLGTHARQWGIALQLYTLRSRTNWGIGDFGDLLAFVGIAADAGADYIGLNPLHAPHRTDPAAASPYAPTSRRFLNWLYIDVEAIPEATDPAIRAAIDAPAFQAQLTALRATPIVDYVGVARAKDAILRQCFAVARTRLAASAGFARFVADGGTALERFATFETLVERLGRDVAAWPAAYRDPSTDDVRGFVEAERSEIDYAIYLQFHAARQLAAVARIAARDGIALYRDLAVGVDASGADVWIEPHAYVPSVSVGCPPDQLNPDGQDWGLPPLHPSTLARDGYRTIAELFRSNMACAGALRIDHAMSLARLFWSPRGRSALEGTYVAYPLEDVLGVLALESIRARCTVIGEDLGTVPPGFRERLRDAHVLSYRILFFERDYDGAFVAAEHYPALSLAACGTHDLATFAAWLRGSDIELRAQLGVGGPERVSAERTERDADRQRLLTTLRTSGDLAADASSHADIVLAAHRFLARSPARIVMLQIDDALAEELPINVPGTADEYPNWRRKLRVDLDLVAADTQFAALCAMLRTERPRHDIPSG